MAAVPKIDSSELKELTEKLMTACHILDHEGVTDGYGHISVRVPGADAFVTIANVSPGCVTRDRLIMQDFDGNHLDGAKTPPNEWPIHACILKARPEIVSVAHTHSKWSTIFSVLPIKLKPMHHYGKFLSADGPPVYQGVGLVRTLERGNELAAALGNGPGC
jgi:ribulose-5-phosphate 4-epimerase/fuculose-1-phosphate aldolase